MGEIMGTTATPKCMYLVEGGRLRMPQRQVPLPTPHCRHWHTHRKHPHTAQFESYRVYMAIDRDFDSLFLTFNFAVAFFASTDSAPLNHKKHHIQIWRVTLALDDQQHGIGLTAVHLVSFLLEHANIRVFALSILGPHLALSLFSFSRRRCRQFTFGMSSFSL